MNGLITINLETSILTDVSQGIYRLRNINIGHRVNFYCSEIKNIDINAEYIYEKLKINEENYKKTTEPYMYL